MLIALYLAACAVTQPPAPASLPVVLVQADDTALTTSCRVEIPPGLILEDLNRDGVIRVAASDIVIEFAPGSVLRGAVAGAAPDTYEGYGVRIDAQRNVTVRGGRISGYRAGVWARAAPGLTLEGIEASDGRRARLYSTPEREAGRDWLYPHNNDTRPWLEEYGASLYVERSAGVTIRDCRVRQSQNALCLDRVDDSWIYDNDFSFNSGWGIALWRSCRNVISRNACDFCIRGYSHGVYNRGQDSAGLLFFEQCSDNTVAENSATHGGDGFFGYAGNDALRLSAPPADAPAAAGVRGLGCDRNLLINNDFSYAAAHGIELTFSFDNRFIGNRLVGNAICGVWAGYSQGTLIAGNRIADNGGAGYALERGGVNIDSSRANCVLLNAFARNACGVHLWWHEQPADRLAWAACNLPDWDGNEIAWNTFDADELTFHFRGAGRVTLGPNRIRSPQREADAAPEMEIRRAAADAPPQPRCAVYPVRGRRQPVGARPALAGRENIIMGEWGPWDHREPFVRRMNASGSAHRFELHGFGGPPRCTVEGAARWTLDETGDPRRLLVAAAQPGVYPYTVRIEADGFRHELRGVLLEAEWELTCFTYSGDPVGEREAWRAAAAGPGARRRPVSRLDDGAQLACGPDSPTSAPREPAENEAPTAVQGWIARTRLPIPAGAWRISAITAGAVHIAVDGREVLDAWRPRTRVRSRSGQFVTDGEAVEITVEHFSRHDPSAVRLEIVPAEPGAQHVAD